VRVQVDCGLFGTVLALLMNKEGIVGVNFGWMGFSFGDGVKVTGYLKTHIS
jgi:hypothetical protein